MKLNYDYVKEYIESFGYKLTSKEYMKSNLKLDMICDKGHECSISWDNFKYGRRCRACADLSKANKFKLNYNEVKSYIEKYGCTLISKDYINNSQKLSIICSCGDKFEISFSKFRLHKKCIKCRDRKSNRLTYEHVKAHIESFGYTLLSDEYISANKKIKVQCDKKHPPYEVKFGNFHSGKRCPHCSKSYKPTIEEVSYYLSKFNYICLDSEYKRAKQKINMICDKGHEIEVSLSDFKSGCRCSICSMSKGEMKIEEYLIKNNIEYHYDTKYFKDLISPKGNMLRPDFILPNEKIWIEYDGEFHYKKVYEDDGHEKLRIHDKLKDEYAKENNWKMIRIPYWDFDNIENILNIEIFNME